MDWSNLEEEGEEGVLGVQKADNLEDDELEHAAAQRECRTEEELDDWVLCLIVFEQLFSIEEQPEAEVGPVQNHQQERLLQQPLHLSSWWQCTQA
jgi:hypothetical protein